MVKFNVAAFSVSLVLVFVLTHHKREPVIMHGGTTFYFLTGGIESALEKAKKATGGKGIGAGVSTVRQFLRAGLIDEIHLAFPPVFLGAGEHVFSEIDLPGRGFIETQKAFGEDAVDTILTKAQ